MKTFSLLIKVYVSLLLFAIFLGICIPASASNLKHSVSETDPCDSDFPLMDNKRFSIKLFPVINKTDFQVWESKYYPYSILEKKINEYLETLFMDNPRMDAEVLDTFGMNRWLASPRRGGDMAAQIEIYNAHMKTRDNVLGNYDTNAISMRVRVYDSINGENFADQPVHGKDKRYTFAPSEGQLFYLDSMISLPIPFADGLDLLGLTKSKYKGQKMTYPTWAQFNETSTWQAFKNATKAAHRQIMMQTSGAITRNSGGSEIAATLAGSFTSAIGRIISPTASSTRRNREYIISLGEMDAVSVGDVLDVIRSDTYITVDPERPVVVIPKEIGKVRVKWVQEREAIVTVTQEKDKKDPIQLKDIVVKKYAR